MFLTGRYQATQYLSRQVIATLAVTLLWTTMAGALQGQPSVRPWGVSVLLGVGSPDDFVGLVDGKTLAASGLIVDYRRPGRRLGYRVEFLQREEQGAVLGRIAPCPQCSHALSRTDRAAMVTASWEFRAGRRLRPYALLGAGIGFTRDQEVEFYTCSAVGTCSASARREVAENSWTQATLGMGTGLALHLGRFAPFAESRIGSGVDLFSVGLRLRP